MASSEDEIDMASDDDGLGYAPAAGPGDLATTIRTNSDGLEAGPVELAAGDRDIPAYAAWPSGTTDRPVVLVLSEAFGLHEHIADVVRRFAHAGYFAVAPDLMVRQGDPRTFDDVGALVSDLLLRIPDEQVMDDLDATVAWASALGADTSRLAVSGFCWGGRWTWLYAAHRPMAAGVAWYGIVDGTGTFPDAPQRFPRHPLDLAPLLQTPVLGLYGGQDDAIPTATVEELERRLADGTPDAVASELVLFPRAGHAFFADYRESYEARSAQEAWARCLGWIDDRTRP